MSFPEGETVTLRVAGVEKDAENNERPTFTPTDYPGSLVYPRGSAELVSDGDIVIDHLTVLIPVPGLVVRPIDKMTIRGNLYDVDGAGGFDWSSADWDDFPGVQVNVTKWTG